MVAIGTAFLVSREQLVMIEGTITPATPNVAALPRKLRLEIPEFFILHLVYDTEKILFDQVSFGM